MLPASLPQLFRRVAAALPGMDATQDKSREDSILLTTLPHGGRGQALPLLVHVGKVATDLSFQIKCFSLFKSDFRFVSTLWAVDTKLFYTSSSLFYTSSSSAHPGSVAGTAAQALFYTLDVIIVHQVCEGNCFIVLLVFKSLFSYLSDALIQRHFKGILLSRSW